MNLTDLTTYLGGLLDRPVDATTRITLTSGQQARLQSWVHQRGVNTQALNLAKTFTSEELLGASPSGVASSSSAASATVASTAASGAVSIGSLGVDIQSIAELIPSAALADLKASAELAKIFTLRELSYAQTRPDPASTLAGLFAAKEAVKKASPAHLAASWTQLEILPNALGAPTLSGFSLSISHSKDYAVAVAMAASVSAPVMADATAPPVLPPSAKAVNSQGSAPSTAPASGGAGRYALTAWALLATAGCIYLAR